MREHAELDRVVQACIEQGTTCWPTPSAFTRFALYAFIALAQVIALFTISVSVESPAAAPALLARVAMKGRPEGH